MANNDETPNPIYVTINGEQYQLKCSRHADRLIDENLGGVQPAVNAVTNLNRTAIVHIIAAGAGLRLNRKQADRFYDYVCKNMDTVIGPVSDYVVRLANNGRDPEQEEEDDENPPKPAPKAKQASE